MIGGEASGGMCVCVCVWEWGRGGIMEINVQSVQMESLLGKCLGDGQTGNQPARRAKAPQALALRSRRTFSIGVAWPNHLISSSLRDTGRCVLGG